MSTLVEIADEYRNTSISLRVCLKMKELLYENDPENVQLAEEIRIIKSMLRDVDEAKLACECYYVAPRKEGFLVNPKGRKFTEE